MANSRFRVSVGPRAVRIIEWFNRNPSVQLRLVENEANRVAIGQLERLKLVVKVGAGYLLASHPSLHTSPQNTEVAENVSLA